MNMTDLATWGQLISSAAVLVTLVYLSIQTKQTATLLRSESRQSIIEQEQQTLYQFTSWPTLLLAQLGEGEMTMEDKARLWAQLAASMRTREHQWLQYQNGVLDPETWAAYRTAIPATLNHERTRTWWATMGCQYYVPAFVKMVDALLDRHPPNNDWHDQMLAWN